MRGTWAVVGVTVGCLACGSGSPGGPSQPVPAPPAPPVAAMPSPAPSEMPSPQPTAMPSPDPTAPPTTEVLRSANLNGANGHNASGSARIVREGNSYRLELRNDFRIDGGENDVYLAHDNDTIAGGLKLGALRSLTGGQSYDMPNDGGQYGFVILWCRPFQIPIGRGQFR